MKLGSVAAVILYLADGEVRAASLPFWQVARVSAEHLPCLRGRVAERVALMACRERCEPIPWQLDERDAEGRLALDAGPEPNPDDPPGIIDDNDELLWMLEDAGRPMHAGEVSLPVECAVEIRTRQGRFAGRVYALALPGPAPRSPIRYVEYDVLRDVMAGARVSMGFGGPTPRYLALKSPHEPLRENLLDRLKIRASAWFFGLIPVGRDEDDIQTQFVAWRAGPVRIIRRQRQWVRLGWGLRTPILRSEMLFYRDFAELPVHLRLNFPPTFFFKAFEVRAVLDFRDLRGWSLLAPDLPQPVLVGAPDRTLRKRLNQLPGDWFALRGPEATLIQVLETGPSLASVRRQLVYREETGAQKPEAVRGEMPGVGYRLTRWDDVDRGAHWFASINYAVPASYDLERFLRQRRREIVIETHPFPEPPSSSPTDRTGESKNDPPTPLSF